jgi:hypothetical protein
MTNADDALDPRRLRAPLDDIEKIYRHLAAQAREAGSEELAQAIEAKCRAEISTLEPLYDALRRRMTN